MIDYRAACEIGIAVALTPPMRSERVRRTDIGVAVSVVTGILTATLTSVAVAPSTGCFGCTLIGWYEGLRVELTPADLPDGRYHFEVVADGEPLVISVDVAAGGVTCLAPEDDCVLERELGDGRRVSLMFDVSTLVVWYHDDDGLDGGPEEAIVSVSRDNVDVASEVFEPQYTHEEINGRGCGWATYASETMALE